ncbi:hypothetical protein HYZ80_02785 [Candidatus Parcubacteria bacterium]|nr:hypothetical protein [Candidatus Parcubacteria bacterium]
MDPALLSYILEARAAGLTDDQIVEELQRAGWDETAVREAVGASEYQSFTGPPALYTPRPENQLVRLFHNARRSLGFKMGVAVLGLAAIGAGAYAGWRYYDSLPAKALADMPRKMADLKSASYRAEVRVRLGPSSKKSAVLNETDVRVALAQVEPNAVQVLPKGIENAQIEWRVSGAYATRAGAPSDFSALLDFNLEMGRETIAVTIELRQVEGTFYLRLVKFPTELLGGFSSDDLSRYLNQWYSFKIESLKKYLPDFERESVNANLNLDQEQKIRALVAKANLYHIQSVTRNEKVEGAGVYRYLVNLLTENFITLVREASAVLNERALTPEAEAGLRNVLGQFAQAKVQLWVGKDDHLLRRSHITIDDLGVGGYSLPAEITLELSDFNRAVVTAPEGALPLEKVIEDALNASRIKSRDARRLADMRQIQLALELFADNHRQAYPPDIYALTPCGRASACGLASPDACGSTSCIAVVPVDPLDGGRYVYNPHLTRRTIDAYHLGTSLEDPARAELQSDRDCNSATGENCPFPSGWDKLKVFNGSDRQGCLGEAGRACYDLTP